MVKAELGDGTEAVFETYACTLEWFGVLQEIEALESSAGEPLLGVGLLNGHELLVNYRNKLVALT